MRQFGRFLLTEKLSRTSVGTLWRAVQVWEDGFEHTFIEQLDTKLTNHQDFIERLTKMATFISGESTSRLAALDELGMHERRYYLSGQLPDGQRLSDVIARCESLDYLFPVEAAVRIAQSRLKTLDRQLKAANNEQKIVRGPNSQNLWLGYDGRIVLGWSDLVQIPDGAARARATMEIIQDLGQSLVSGRRQGAEPVPSTLSQWLRETLASDLSSAENGPSELALALEEAWPKTTGTELGVEALLADLFEREIQVDKTRRAAELRELTAMPEGARSIIARSQPFVVVPRKRPRRVETLVAVTEDEGQPVFTGDLTVVDLPRMLYRYAAARLTGRLHLQSKKGKTLIDWENGRVISVSASKPLDFSSFLETENIFSRESQVAANLPPTPTEEQLIRAIVDSGQATHTEVLAVLERYARERLLALFRSKKYSYAVTPLKRESAFPFGPRELCTLLNEGVSAHVGAVPIEGFISAHHRHTMTVRNHRFIEVGDLHLTTKQLRLWNTLQSGLTVAEQMTRWIAIPAINHDTASRLLTLLERLDFLSLEAP